MKRILNKLETDEKGQALLIVLILLVIGGLIIGPLLGFMSTGLIVGQVYEERMDELYAADSGVEDAIWKIMNEQIPAVGDQPYTIADVNAKGVSVTIEDIDDHTYKITSIATTDADSSTTIESYITVPDFNFVLENAITSRNDIQIGNNSTVVGDVLYNGEIIWQPNSEHPSGVENTELITEWPTEELLAWFYEWDVKNLSATRNPYPEPEIDVKYDPFIDSLKRYEDLDIISSMNDVTAELGGTVYVTGNLNIAGPKDFTLDLSGQTIFVEGTITGGPKLTITGSGCIIAVGRIDLSPHISSSGEVNDFVLIMSVTDEVKFNPLESFYGAVVGDSIVDMQPNCYLEWVNPYELDEDINFPWEGFSGGKVITVISTWEISLQ